MEVDGIQTPQPPPAYKFSRVNSNGAKIGTHHDKSEEAELRRGGTIPTTTTTTAAGGGSSLVNTSTTNGSGGGGGGEIVVTAPAGANNRLRQWQHSSRIIRVSRASGGKDRHSKVWTAKGPRDRRVRLSVTTAIQFYDLQDRLGYDQPSKAVEWLIKAAAEAINELPSLNGSAFPPDDTIGVQAQAQAQAQTQAQTPQLQQLSDEVGRPDSADPELDGEEHHGSLMGVSKSGCSSNNSETSKGSGLSLSRSEIRVKARERARERTAKEKEREIEQPTMEATTTAARVSNNSSNNNNVGNNNHNHHHHHNQHQQPPHQTSTFTQLLTAGISSNAGRTNTSTTTGPWGLSTSTSTTTPPMDYFGVTTSTGLMGHSSSSRAGLMTISPFSIGGVHENHQELHNHHSHFPFLDHQQQHHHHNLVQVPHTAGGGGVGGGGGNNNDYNLNFTISSSATNSSQLVVGFNNNNNRGTLQSNSSSSTSSSSLLPYLQRFSATTDGSSLPFFLGGTAVENHQHHHQHQQQQQFHPPAGLQLCYGDGNHHGQSDQKGKGKN